MKTLLSLTLVAFLASAGSYWYGVTVGMQQKQLNYLGVKAHDLALHRYDRFGGEERDKSELEVDELLIHFGWYLEERMPFIPGYYSLEKSSIRMFKDIAQYRLNSPRVKDGVEYYPYKRNWEQGLKDTEVNGKPIDPALVKHKTQEFKNNERRFKLALKYFEG